MSLVCARHPAERILGHRRGQPGRWRWRKQEERVSECGKEGKRCGERQSLLTVVYSLCSKKKEGAEEEEEEVEEGEIKVKMEPFFFVLCSLTCTKVSNFS